MSIVQKNDFVEIEFIGRIKDTKEIFDTNIKSEIDKLGLKLEAKPYSICIGMGMSIKGLDADIESKEVGKDYFVEIAPEDAFGKRNPAMIKTIPIKFFSEQKIAPQREMQLSINGSIAKIVSISGGRVLVDFNNPISGKTVSYSYKIIKKINNTEEKINALQDFFFKKRFNFEIKEKEAIFKTEKESEKLVEVMLKPFESVLGVRIRAERP